jgi:hypothetical protein
MKMTEEDQLAAVAGMVANWKKLPKLGYNQMMMANEAQNVMHRIAGLLGIEDPK